MRYMMPKQRAEFFEARAAALRGAFAEQIRALDAKSAEIDTKRQRWRKAEAAIACAEQFYAAGGLPTVAAEMLTALASDADMTCEFYDAESRILDEADAAASGPEGEGEGDGSHREGYEQGAKQLGVGEVF